MLTVIYVLQFLDITFEARTQNPSTVYLTLKKIFILYIKINHFHTYKRYRYMYRKIVKKDSFILRYFYLFSFMTLSKTFQIIFTKYHIYLT